MFLLLTDCWMHYVLLNYRGKTMPGNYFWVVILRIRQNAIELDVVGRVRISKGKGIGRSVAGGDGHPISQVGG